MNFKMALYETGILLDGKVIVQKIFFNHPNVLYQQLRDGLLNVISSFVRDAFSTEFESFSSNNYTMFVISEKFNGHVLMMFCLIERKTKEKIILNRMREAFKRFLIQFSKNDILTKDPIYFTEFSNVLNQIFGDLGFNHKKTKNKKKR